MNEPFLRVHTIEGDKKYEENYTAIFKNFVPWYLRRQEEEEKEDERKIIELQYRDTIRANHQRLK